MSEDAIIAGGYEMTVGSGESKGGPVLLLRFRRDGMPLATYAMYPQQARAIAKQLTNVSNDVAPQNWLIRFYRWVWSTNV